MNKTKKFNAKFLSLLLAFCMVVIMMPMVAFAAAPIFGGGNGSSSEPYIISTEQHLINLATAVNGGENYSNKYFKQTANITVTNFVPIGISEDNSFMGTYDGGNNEINGTIGDSEKNHQGLFGVIGIKYSSTPAVIKNIINNATVKGCRDVGAIVGLAYYSEVENCVNNGIVKGFNDVVGGVVGYSYAAIINDCCNTGDVIGEYEENTFTHIYYGGWKIGGVAGYSYGGETNNCHNEGSVRGRLDVGGVIGGTTGEMTSCSNIGNVTGHEEVAGIAGRSDAIIENCYNKGNITATGESSAPNDITHTGGIVGYNMEEIKNCYNSGDVSGEVFVGGITTINNSGSIENCYNTGVVMAWGGYFGAGIVYDNRGTVKNCYYNYDKTSSNSTIDGVSIETTDSMITQDFVDNLNNGGSAFSLKAMSDCKAYYPYLTSFGEDSAVVAKEYAKLEDLTGTGTVGSPYLIENEQDLIDLSEIVYCGNNCDDKFFKQTADITVTNFVPIGNITNTFKGTYDGDNHQINGTIGNESELNQGLFGSVGEGGIIKNVANHAIVKGKSRVGAIVGYSIGGTVENCYNTGDVIGEEQEIGGIVGYKSGGSITSCYNTGDVEGDSKVGGIAGYNSGGSTTNCYSAGDVIGTTQVGGFTGSNMGTISNSYYDTDKCSETSTPYGVTGKTTEEMATQAIVDDLNNSGSAFSYRTASKGKTYYPYLTSFGEDSAVVASHIVIPTYNLTVANGNGDGDYAENTVVNITADTAPSGEQFKNWTSNNGGTFADANSATTTFTMPANAVTVTAIYEEIPVTSHTITATAGTNGTISPSGAVTVADGGSRTFTFTPATGYEIGNLTVNSVTEIPTGNSYTIANVKDDMAIHVEFVKTYVPTLPTVTGNNQTMTVGTAKDVIFKIDDHLDNFNRLEYKGSTLDSANYTATSGSIIITLKGDYVKTLAVGTHTFTAIIGNYNVPMNLIVEDEKESEVTPTKPDDTSKPDITPKPEVTPTPDTETPQTGDNSNVWLFFALAVLSLGGISLTVFKRKIVKLNSR